MTEVLPRSGSGEATRPFLPSWLPPFISVVAVVGTVLHHYQVSLTDELKYGGYLLIVIFFPGISLWRHVRTRFDVVNRLALSGNGLEDLICGAAMGYVVEIPCYCFARWVNHPRLYVLGPLLVLGLSLIGNLRHARTGVAPIPNRLGIGPVWALASIACYTSVWLGRMGMAGAPLFPTGRIGDPDETFHLALIGELRNHFPAVYPYVPHQSLTYQYFVHAHMAASSWVTGLSPVEIYSRFDPIVLTILASIGTAAVTQRLCGRGWISTLAPAILVLVGAFDVTGSIRGEAAPEERFLQAGILINSPTQTFAYVLAIPAIVIIVVLLRRQTRSTAGIWVMLISVLIAVSGAKATYLPVFLAGFVAALILDAAVSRKLNVFAATGAVACLATLLASETLVYRGDTRGLSWHPLQFATFFESSLGLKGGGLTGELLLATSLLACWLLCGVGALSLLRRPTRFDPRLWWFVGSIAAGYGATVLLGHPGMSELYFGRSAAPLVAVSSAWGFSGFFPRGTDRKTTWRALTVATMAGLLLFLVRLATEDWKTTVTSDGHAKLRPALDITYNLPVLLLILTILFAVGLVVRDRSHGQRRISLRFAAVLLVGLGIARTFAFIAGDEAPPRKPDVVPAGGLAAMTWLKTHSDPSTYVATNAHCEPFTRSDRRCDSRNFWMSAFSQRRFVLEGWAYTGRGDGGWTGPFWGDKSLLHRNDAIFAKPSAAQVEAFAALHDVGWLVVDSSNPVDLRRLESIPAVQVRFAEGRFTVLRIVRMPE